MNIDFGITNKEIKQSAKDYLREKGTQAIIGWLIHSKAMDKSDDHVNFSEMYRILKDMYISICEDINNSDRSIAKALVAYEFYLDCNGIKCFLNGINETIDVLIAAGKIKGQVVA